MSWSVSAIGRAAKIAKTLESDFNRVKCEEPEQTIKENTKASVLAALGAMDPNSAVKVAASGSQFVATDGVRMNTLNVIIEPIYGFVD